ncbi:MAG: hypothetical protein JKX72_08015, partial [Robiginitomaculum sp.]|nr:hypothetical protein [Robiginitomaculum sp.]
MSIFLTMAAQASGLDPVAATEVWMSTMSAAEIARSDSYFEGGYWLTLWNFILGIIVAWIILSGERSARLRDWLSGKISAILIKPAYIFIYILSISVLVFPMTLYQGFFREKQYDLLNLSLGGWLGELLIGLGLSLVLGTLALWGLYVLMRKLGPAWRWWGAGASMVFLTFILLISPVFIAPLFNDYYPMEDGPLKTQILAMADANGVPVDNVY